MATPREPLSTARDRFNAGDHEGYLELYDDGVLLYGLGPEPLDKAGVRAFYEGFFSAFQRPQIDIQEVLEDGDTLAVRFLITARHVGDFLGVSATDRDIAFTGITTAPA